MWNGQHNRSPWLDRIDGYTLVGQMRFTRVKESFMPEKLTADEICTLLALTPNATCGSVMQTYRNRLSTSSLPPPFDETRPVGSALYFLVTPTAPVRLHRIRNDQLYHYYLGDPLELFLLHSESTAERVIIGADLRAGEHVQFLIPGGTLHTARLVRGGSLAGAQLGRVSFQPTSKLLRSRK
jgi:predicted cupin superfamily sugar epimerase